MPNSFKDSLNLPSTQFPMKASLATREPERIERWESRDLYQAIQEKNKDGESYILHDGPPFANGEIHLGHVLNKVLKDIVLRYKSMRGFRTPYVAGWDCHGLPIEHAVSKEMRKQGGELGPVEVRRACEAFAEKFIGIQKKQFRRLGILTDWDRFYKTMDPAYEAEIIRTFADFVDKGLVYRSKKPVYWSIPCKTALAEAEIEYKEHVSPSIWVKFAVEDAKINGGKRAHVVIWTTTPWTIPANLAIALHPRLEYVEVGHGGETYIVARELAESFIEACKLEGATLGAAHKGETLEGVKARHPFIDRESPIVLADYVTTESGTGAVHTAPGHGLEDYLTGLNYGLDIYCPLDDDGAYVDDGQMPERLVGVSVLEAKPGKCPANSAVLELLTEKRALLEVKRYEHQYPHCWRSGTPVVFRAMDQWFVALDKDGMRQKVLDAIGQVKWHPAWGENRIRGAVESRPDWCISRQRAWGVPLPVFFDEEGEPYLDAGVIRGIADKIAAGGTNLWYSQSSNDLLEGLDLPENWKGKRLKAGTDTLDVWIDSGTSHRAVLKVFPELAWPADLYLEGSDQHRGWFQSSLWTGVVTEGSAPYKSILTHGFIVDDKGKKFSKSKGDTAEGYMDKIGADVLRLVFASEDYSGDIAFSEAILKQVSNTYRLFRNTLRFQLGNLADFDEEKDAVPVEEMTDVDRWALHKTAELVEQVTAAYDNFEFHRVYQLTSRFCSVTLSAVYHDLLKDRLYTYASGSPARRSAQSALAMIFDALNRLLAPILVFTADEAHCHRRANEDFAGGSIHLEAFPSADGWKSDEVATRVDALFRMRESVNEHLERLRVAKSIGKGLDAVVTLKAKGGSAEAKALLEADFAELAELFIVSEVKTEADETLGEPLSVEAVPAESLGYNRCPRCWRWVEELLSRAESEVCPRCAEALDEN